MNFKTKIAVKGLILALALSCSSQNAFSKTFISMGTNPVGMALYTMGAALSEVLRTEAPDIELTIEATNGAVHNVGLMSMGDIEMALTAPKDAQDGYLAQGRYSEKVPLLGLFSAAEIYSHCVALEGNGIKSIEDLKGKRVGVGVGGSSTRDDNQDVLSAANMTFKDMNAFSETLPEAVEKMKNGQLDASLWFGVAPLVPYMDLAQSRDLTWFAISKEQADELSKRVPYFYYSVLPANSYPNQDKAVPTVASRNIMIVAEDMDEEVAYQITKATFENLEKLSTIYKGWSSVSLEGALQSMLIPLHPGAVRYFREVNLPGLDEHLKKYPNK